VPELKKNNFAFLCF